MNNIPSNQLEVKAKERASLITEDQVEAILRPFAEKGQFEATINVNHTCTELLRSRSIFSADSCMGAENALIAGHLEIE